MKIAGACGRLALYQSTLALGPPPRRPSLRRPAAADEFDAIRAVTGLKGRVDAEDRKVPEHRPNLGGLI
jgi:hypothetical protein